MPSMHSSESCLATKSKQRVMWYVCCSCYKYRKLCLGASVFGLEVVGKCGVNIAFLENKTCCNCASLCVILR